MLLCSRSCAARPGCRALAPDEERQRTAIVWIQMRRSTIEDYARRGLLPSLKLGRHRRFIRSDVLDALDGLRRQAS
jgi:excisionase family DNA binding protein